MSLRNIIHLLFLFLMITVALLSCSNNKKQQPKQKLLTGWLTKDNLLQEIPQYKAEMDLYQPDSTVIANLNTLEKLFTLNIFLGTYCSDCKREVPRFLKMIEQLNSANFSYRLFGLNRAAADTSGMREKFNIEYVPTFIVYHNEEEIGRIIERPMVSLENDLLEICLSVD